MEIMSFVSVSRVSAPVWGVVVVGGARSCVHLLQLCVCVRACIYCSCVCGEGGGGGGYGCARARECACLSVHTCSDGNNILIAHRC